MRSRHIWLLAKDVFSKKQSFRDLPVDGKGPTSNGLPQWPTQEIEGESSVFVQMCGKHGNQHLWKL